MEPDSSPSHKIIEQVFKDRFNQKDAEVTFDLDDVIRACVVLDIPRPRNIYAVVYAFRTFQQRLPRSILELAPPGKTWVIRQVGKGRFHFAAVDDPRILPSADLGVTSIPDATPGLVADYIQQDEKGLLAVIRYNRLIDLFTGLVAHSLYTRMRTRVADVGQVETDELYLALDSLGRHYVVPLHAKGLGDQLSLVQIEQDVSMCREKFPALECTPIAAQYAPEGWVILFGFDATGDGLRVSKEQCYRLVGRPRS